MDRAVEAARQGDLAYFTALPPADLQAVLSKRDDDERSVLHTACATSNFELVQFLVDNEAKDCVKWTDEEGWTPLHTAVSAAQEATVKLLLSLGADVNAATAQKRTALHYAASKGLTALAQLLLDSGAEVDARDVMRATPLHRAAATGHTGVIRVLLDRQPKPKLDARNQEGATPLLLAALGGHQAAALLLTAQGADVEAEDKDGETPLGAAVPHGKLRDGLAAIAKGEKTLDDFMLD
ncbi:26S proteasome non-ATPase regulatory subunit 10 [Chlorella vulgaris]